MQKSRGEVVSLVLVGGLIVASLASVITISFFQSQKTSYKSEALDTDALCNKCYPAGQQGGCATGYICKTVADTTCGGLKYYCAKDTTTSTTTTNTTNTTTTSTTKKCPSGVGTYSIANGPGLCNSQCSVICKTCLLNSTEKYYCPSSDESSGSKLPSCTTPNAFSKTTCEQSCGGANSCERCQISGGSQKYHCKTNINTQNLKSCTGGSYKLKEDCNPHCVTQCRECKVNTTIKYECPSEFNNIKACTKSWTYGSIESCQSGGVDGQSKCTQSCTLCETAPGTTRYECGGSGPTVPDEQTPIGLGDCNSPIVSGGHIANGQTACSASGTYTVTCNNGTTTTESCAGRGCTGGKCNEPSPTPSPTPITVPSKPQNKDADNNTLPSTCQYTCRKYNCSSNEIQVSQSCQGFDMACCRVPENKDDVVGKTCYYDSDCGDIAKNECKLDSVTNQRYCIARITPLKDTQCTSVNIGFPCNYTTNGKVYSGICQCNGTSCSCFSETENSPIAPTTKLLNPTPIPTINFNYTHCLRNCDGTCVTHPDGYVECVPFSTAETKSDPNVNCGAIYQECCIEYGDFSNIAYCQNNLHCSSTSSGVCVPDEEYEKGIAAAEVLTDYLDQYTEPKAICKTLSCSVYGYHISNECQPKCFNNCCIAKQENLDTAVENFITTNVGDNPIAQEQFKQKLTSSCTELDGKTPCNGSCVYSKTESKFVCTANDILNNYYEQVKEPDAKNVGDSCIPLFSSCKSELLECISGKCQIKEEAKQFLGYGAAETGQSSINSNQDTADLLTAFATNETKTLANNNEYSQGACSSTTQTGEYTLLNGQCWVCLDPTYHSMGQVPNEYCNNTQLQETGANFGISCKQTSGNYCAKSGSGCTSNGQSDCPNGWNCCSGKVTKSLDSKKTGNLNDSCSEYPIVSDNEFGDYDHTCKPGLKCVDKVCRDDISLAYDNNYNSGTSATNSWGGLFDVVINPMIRSISPTYYETGEIRAEVTESTMQSCYKNAVANGSDPNTCDSLFNTVDQLAQTDMTQNKLEELNPEGLTWQETAYNVIQEVGKFASAYSGEQKTVSTLTYAKKSAELNADPNANALNYLEAAAQPGLEIGLTVADLATLGLADSIFTAASKALKTTAIEISQGAIQTGVREIVEEGAEQALRQSAQQITEEVIEQVNKEALQQITTKTTQESAQQILEEATQQAAEEVAERLTQESTQALVAETTQQAAINAAEAVAEEIGQATSKTITPEAIEQIAQEAAESAYKEITPKVATHVTGTIAQKTADEIIHEAAQKAASEAATKMLQEAGQKSAQEIAQEVAQKVTQETAQTINSKITKETVQGTTQQLAEKVSQEFIPKITAEMTPKAIKQTIREATETITKQVADQILTNTQTVSTVRTTIAKSLNALGTMIDTGTMANKLLEMPMIGPALSFIEKTVGTVIAAPVMAGAGGLGLLSRGIKSSILPDLIQRFLPNLTQSQFERTVLEEISQMLSKKADGSLDKITLQMFDGVKESLLKKYPDKNSQIIALIDAQITKTVSSQPLTDDLITDNLIQYWETLRTKLVLDPDIDKAVLSTLNDGPPIPTSLIPQLKMIAEAQQLATKWNIPLNSEQQITNYLANYSKLVEKQLQGIAVTPTSFVQDLVNGGMSFQNSNKLAAGLIYEESPLLLNAKQAHVLAEKQFEESLLKLSEAQSEYQKALDELSMAKQTYDQMTKKSDIPKSDLNKAKQNIERAQKNLIQAENNLASARAKTITEAKKLNVNMPNQHQKLITAHENLNRALANKNIAETRLLEATDSMNKKAQQLADLQAKLKKADSKSKKKISKQIQSTKKQLASAQVEMERIQKLVKQAEINLTIAQNSFDQLLVNTGMSDNLLSKFQDAFDGLSNRLKNKKNPQIPNKPDANLKPPDPPPGQISKVTDLKIEQATNDIIDGKLSLTDSDLITKLKHRGLSDEQISILKNRFEIVSAGRKSDNIIKILDPGVSRQHANLIVDRETTDLYLQTVSSTNHSLIRKANTGKFVAADSLTKVEPGDLLRFGDASTHTYVVAKAPNGQNYLINVLDATDFHRVGARIGDTIFNEQQFAKQVLDSYAAVLPPISMGIDEYQESIRRAIANNPALRNEQLFIPLSQDDITLFNKKLGQIQSCIKLNQCSTGVRNLFESRSQRMFGKNITQLTLDEQIALASRAIRVESYVPASVWEKMDSVVRNIFDDLKQIAHVERLNYDNLSPAHIGTDTQYFDNMSQYAYGDNAGIDDIHLYARSLQKLNNNQKATVMLHELIHSIQRATGGMNLWADNIPNASFGEVFTDWLASKRIGIEPFSGYKDGVNKLSRIISQAPDPQRLTKVAQEVALNNQFSLFDDELRRQGLSPLKELLDGFSDYHFYNKKSGSRGLIADITTNLQEALFPQPRDPLNLFIPQTKIPDTTIKLSPEDWEKNLNNLFTDNPSLKNNLSEHEIVLLSDLHSDAKTTKELLIKAGVLDHSGNYTGKPVIFNGDYFGKTSAELIAEDPTPGLSLLQLVTDLQRISPNSVVAHNGNWEPRMALAMRYGQLQKLYPNDPDLINKLLALEKKTLSRAEYLTAISDPELLADTLARLTELKTMTVFTDGTILQHVDTAETIRYLFSSLDEVNKLFNNPKLESYDPDLAKTLTELITARGGKELVTITHLEAVRKAAEVLNLGRAEIANRINTNVSDIMTKGITDIFDQEAGEALEKLATDLGKDLDFYAHPEIALSFSEIFESQTIIHGHTPIDDIVKGLNQGDLSSLFSIIAPETFRLELGAKKLNLMAIDDRLSRGMRVRNPLNERGFLPVIEGIMAFATEQGEIIPIERQAWDGFVSTIKVPSEFVFSPAIGHSYDLNQILFENSYISPVGLEINNVISNLIH